MCIRDRSYTCKSDNKTNDNDGYLFIFGQNTQTPTFERGTEYGGTISKSMTPVGISLDCLPQNTENDFDIVVVDGDHIAPNDTDPNADQGSSNVVICSTKKGESLDEYFVCAAEEVAPGTPGRYKINLTVNKSLATITEDVYEFTVVAEVAL